MFQPLKTMAGANASVGYHFHLNKKKLNSQKNRIGSGVSFLNHRPKTCDMLLYVSVGYHFRGHFNQETKNEWCLGIVSVVYHFRGHFNAFHVLIT